jgi:hypothetical protein
MYPLSHPPTLTLPPPSLSVTLPACMWHGGVVAPPPDPQSSPQILAVSLEVWGWEIRTVCVGGGGGRVEVKPRPLQMAVYAETQRSWVPYVLV